MLGPVEGLKVLIEVDATQAQAVLREFSGSVALAGQTAAAGLTPAQQGVQDLLNQIGDTRRRAEELETAMRNTASGAGAAGSSMAGLSSVMSTMLPIMAGIAALGIAKMLWDAAKSTDAMQEAMGSLKEATTNAKTGLGEMVVEATGLNRELLALAGTIQMVTTALQPKEGEFGAGIWTERSRPLLDWLAENAPKPVNYGEAPGLLSEQSRSDEAFFKSLEKSVQESRRLAEEQKKVAAEAAKVQKEFEDSVAHVWRMVAATDKEYWALDAITAKLQEMKGGEEGGAWDVLSDPLGWNAAGSESGGYGAAGMLAVRDAIDATNASMQELGPTLDQLTDQTARFAEVNQFLVDSLFNLAGTMLFAALSGEGSYRKMLKSALTSIGQRAAVEALFEFAKSIADYAYGNVYGGSMHAQAGGMFLGVAAAAGAGVRLIGDTGGGGGGGGRYKNEIKPAPTILPPEHEPQITIIIDGNVIGQEEYVRQLALDAAREMRKAGA